MNWFWRLFFTMRNKIQYHKKIAEMRESCKLEQEKQRVFLEGKIQELALHNLITSLEKHELEKSEIALRVCIELGLLDISTRR